MRLILKNSGAVIELPAEGIEFENTNNLFSFDEVVSEASCEFTIPMTDQNSPIFGYAHNLQVDSGQESLRKLHDCYLDAEGFYMEGRLAITEANLEENSLKAVVSIGEYENIQRLEKLGTLKEIYPTTGYLVMENNIILPAYYETEADIPEWENINYLNNNHKYIRPYDNYVSSMPSFNLVKLINSVAAAAGVTVDVTNLDVKNRYVPNNLYNFDGAGTWYTFGNYQATLLIQEPPTTPRPSRSRLRYCFGWVFQNVQQDERVWFKRNKPIIENILDLRWQVFDYRTITTSLGSDVFYDDYYPLYFYTLEEIQLTFPLSTPADLYIIYIKGDDMHGASDLDFLGGHYFNLYDPREPVISPTLKGATVTIPKGTYFRFLKRSQWVYNENITPVKYSNYYYDLYSTEEMEVTVKISLTGENAKMSTKISEVQQTRELFDLEHGGFYGAISDYTYSQTHLALCSEYLALPDMSFLDLLRMVAHLNAKMLYFKNNRFYFDDLSYIHSTAPDEWLDLSTVILNRGSLVIGFSDFAQKNTLAFKDSEFIHCVNSDCAISTLQISYDIDNENLGEEPNEICSLELVPTAMREMVVTYESEQKVHQVAVVYYNADFEPASMDDIQGLDPFIICEEPHDNPLVCEYAKAFTLLPKNANLQHLCSESVQVEIDVYMSLTAYLQMTYQTIIFVMGYSWVWLERNWSDGTAHLKLQRI